MAHYMLRWQLKCPAAGNVVNEPRDPSELPADLIAAFGGRLNDYHWALGDCDGVGLCEFPDQVTVAAWSIRAAASGAFARFETTKLLLGADV